MSYMVTTSPTLSDEVREFYNMSLLWYARPKLTYGRFARKYTIPKNMGKTMKWRRFSRLAVATTPLGEGITPAPSVLTVTSVQVTVEQYGNWVGFSDRVSVQSIDPIMQENNKLLAFNAAETMDVLARDVFTQGTNVRYVNNRVNRAAIIAGDVINDDEIKRMRKLLSRADTVPLNVEGKSCYVCFIHPDVYFDLMKTDSYQKTGEYQAKELLFTGQVSMLHSILFIETTNAPIVPAGTGGAGAVDVYLSIVFGDNAIGDVDIESLDMEMIFKGLGSGGTYDPLNQRQTQGWKDSYAAKILNDNCLLRVESTVTP